MTTIEHPEAARNAKEPPRDPAVVSIWLAATALAALFALTPLAGVIMGVPVAAASAITGVVVATKVLRRNQRPLIAAIGLLANLIVVALLITGVVLLAFYTEWR